MVYLWKRGRTRILFLPPEGISAPQNKLVTRCWRVYRGKEPPRTPLEKLIKLAGELGVEFRYLPLDSDFLFRKNPPGLVPMSLEELRVFILFEKEGLGC